MNLQPMLRAGLGRLTNALGRFAIDRKGATAVVFTVSLVPVTAGLGMSVDMGRVYLAKSRLQSTLDSAVIASAVAYRTTQDQTKAMNVAAKTFAASGETGFVLDTNASQVDVANSKVTLVATTAVSTPLVGLLSPSRSQITIRARSQAAIQAAGGLGKHLEVALMLDVTTSMNQNSGSPNLTKLQAMQTAAKKLIDTVVQADQSKKTSRVALAPFSSAVNVGSYYSTVNGNSPFYSWKSVVERAGAYALTDDPPSSAYFPSYRSMRSSAKSPSWFIANYERNSSSNRPSSAHIMPLSSDKATLKSSINGYQSLGATAGHIGIAWSWYLLSPNWTSVWTGTATPKPADDKTVKVAVLMSDFDFNVYYQGGIGDMNYQAAQLCANMKSAGIVIYTVGFQVDVNNTQAMNLFTGCASDPSKALTATTGNELISVYDKIAKTVVASVSTPIRLSQ